MSRMIRIALLATVALGVTASGASAELFTNNLAGYPAGTLTWDNQTLLQWVDLTETHGLTYNEAVADDLVVVHGFRHATRDEVETLFIHAGFLTTDNTNDPMNDPAADNLLGLMGCTQFCGTVNATGRGFAENAPPWLTRPNYHKSGKGAGAAVISLQTTDKDLADATAGHFLVRLKPPPKPPTCGLGPELLVAMPLLLVLRRRRRA